jgi:creatinine amidohydrolase
VMAERPALVRRDIQDALAPNPASLSDAIRKGASTFADAGGPRAYFGWPADATAEEGRTTVLELGRILRDAVLETLRPGQAA